jgi:hypothetical protein
MEYDELMILLESDKYLLLPELLTNFKTQVKCLVEQDVGSVMDVLTQAERFLIEPNNFEVIINKSSKIGTIKLRNSSKFMLLVLFMYYFYITYH